MWEMRKQVRVFLMNNEVLFRRKMYAFELMLMFMRFELLKWRPKFMRLTRGKINSDRFKLKILVQFFDLERMFWNFNEEHIEITWERSKEEYCHDDNDRRNGHWLFRFFRLLLKWNINGWWISVRRSKKCDHLFLTFLNHFTDFLILLL